jgi:YVTN family beta-propeller protein
MRRIVRSRVGVVALALVVGLGVAGGVGWAAIPNSASKQITACYPSSGTNRGVLSVVDAQAGGTCPAGDATISWQQNGLRWAGAWSPTTAYYANDLVSYGVTRQVFVALTPSTGQRPASAGLYWRVLGGGKGMTPTQFGENAWWQDPARSAVINVGSNPIGEAFDGSNIWVANFDSNNVSKINPVTDTVTATVAVGSHPQAVAFDGSSIWVANVSSNSVSKINPVTNAVTATVSVGNPDAAVFDGTSIWVADQAFSGSVSKINPATNAVTATVPVGSFPGGVAFDGSSVWVANDGSNSLSKINPTTDTVTATVEVGNRPQAMAFDGNSIWVANENDGTLSKIVPSTNSVYGTINVGSGPVDLAFDGSSMWVGGSTSLSQIDINTLGTLATISTGSADGLAYDGSNLWVAESSGVVVKLRT